MAGDQRPNSEPLCGEHRRWCAQLLGFSPPTFLLGAWGRFLHRLPLPRGDPGSATTLDPWAMGEGQSSQWLALQGVQSSLHRPQGAMFPTCCSWMLHLLVLGEEVTPILFVKARLKYKALLGFAWRPGEG